MKNLILSKIYYLLGVSVLFFLTDCKTSDPVETNAQTPFIQSPLPHLDVAYTRYSFDAEKGALLEYESGTQIKIAPNSLVDSTGKLVKGNIALDYREFHDAVDVLVSGIPMKYDSAGTNQVFQTAGMYDIRAFQGKQALKIAQGKSIEVNMASLQPEANYNFYYLDTLHKKWVYKTTSSVKPNPEKIKLRQEIENKRPVPFSDMFILNYGQAVDIAFGNDQNIVQQNLGIFHQKLKPYGIQYLHNLMLPDRVIYQGNTYPAYDMLWKKLENKTLPQWLNEEGLEWYESESGDWKRAAFITQISPGIYQLSILHPVKKRYFSLKIQAVMRIAAMLKYSPAQWQQNYKQALAEIAQEEEKIKKVADVFRNIEISEFGIYNYDRYFKISDAVVVKADFMLKSNTAQKPVKVYYINTKDRAVIPYDRLSWGKVSLTKDSTAQFFAIMPDYSLAHYTSEEYLKIDFEQLSEQSSPSYAFALSAQTDLVKTRDELRKALRMN
ncbi:MAG: hypothetical protein NW226_12600 [Microscillaceae bacterium]|nr:hypothetical protein [Microscillaceae bacterium]